MNNEQIGMEIKELKLRLQKAELEVQALKKNSHPPLDFVEDPKTGFLKIRKKFGAFAEKKA